MDAINPALGAPTTPSASTTTSGAPSLSQEDFLQIMISELTNQDPLEPMDNGQFLDQLTQMQSLEATTKLTEGIESLVLGQQISSAGVLIGQQVSGVSADGSLVEGVVDRAVLDGDQVQLGIGSQFLALSSVREVTSAP